MKQLKGKRTEKFDSEKNLILEPSQFTLKGTEKGSPLISKYSNTTLNKEKQKSKDTSSSAYSNELRRYAIQFTFRSVLTKDDDKPFFCMCPRCYLSIAWKGGVIETICYLFCIIITLGFKHEEPSKTITSIEIYPKFKDIR